jgi:DNA replication protein DnaC
MAEFCSKCDGNGWVFVDQSTNVRCEACTVREREHVWRESVPGRFADATMAGVTQPNHTVEMVREWLEVGVHDAACLLLLGPVGSGKTYLAYAAALELYLTAGFDVRSVSSSMMLHSLRPDGGATLDDYIDPDLLLLDDLGVEKASQWTDEQLFLVVDERWRRKTASIVTTNLTPTQLEQAVGYRVYDRLAHGAFAIDLDRKSQRQRRVAA